MDIRSDDLPSKEINNPDGEYGEKFEYDPDFKGPLHQHSCTDVVFLFLWIVFIAVWISIGYVAFVNGEPNKLLHPKDSSGKRCGLDEGVKNRPYLMYFYLSKCVSRSSLHSRSDCPKVCVRECPNKHFEFNGLKRYNDTINDLYCTPGTKKKLLSMESIENAVNIGECAAWYVPSQLVGKRCLPVSTIDSTLLMKTGVDENDIIDGRGDKPLVGEMILSALEKHWPWIAAFMCITEIVCIVYIILISRFATFMVWFSILAAVGFGVYCAHSFYMMYKNAPEDSREATVGLTLFIGTIIGLLVLLFIVLFLRKKVNLAIGLIREASRAVNALKSTLAFPVLVWVLQYIVIAWSIVVSFYLFSCGTETYICDGEENKTVSICDPNESPSNCENCTEGQFKYEEYVTYFQVMNLFGFFWGMAFVVGFTEMTLAGAFATWYWTFKKEDVSSSAVLLSIHRTVRYLASGCTFTNLHYYFRVGISTARKTVKEVCESIWSVMKNECIPELSKNICESIAYDFEKNANFPHCIGAVDGKHVRIICPKRSESMYFNYKDYCSVVLMAVADSKYRLIYVNVGRLGKDCDSSIFKQSALWQSVLTNSLQLPEEKCLPGTESPIVPYYFVGDEGFGLHKHLLLPYGGTNVTLEKRIFNYRLCRARRYVEWVFEILSKKWRIYHGPINVDPAFAVDIKKSCVVLHNFVRDQDKYLP